MASFANPRLRRRLAALTAAARDTVKRRQYLRDKARAEASIAAALAQLPENSLAPNPAEISGVRHYRGAAHELASLGDTAELRLADDAFIAGDPELAAAAVKCAAHDAEWVARYAQGDPPPSPGAAPMAWYAWSVAQKS